MEKFITRSLNTSENLIGQVEPQAHSYQACMFRRRGTRLSYPLHLVGLVTESTVVVTDEFEEPCEVWLAAA